MAITSSGDKIAMTVEGSGNSTWFQRFMLVLIREVKHILGSQK